MINLDSENPAGLASFYSAVLGWNVLHSEGDYAMIGDGSINIGFGKVPGYTAPGWPEESGPKRYHLDLYVDDLDAAEQQALDLGASKPAEQPSPDRWRVAALVMSNGAEDGVVNPPRVADLVRGSPAILRSAFRMLRSMPAASFKSSACLA